MTPFDPYHFGEIERQIEEMKRDWEHNRSMYEDRYDGEPTQRKDSVIDGCGILFESLHELRLCKAIKAMERDEELVCKSAQVLGNLQIHKDGNCYISAHQVILTEDPTHCFYKM